MGKRGQPKTSLFVRYNIAYKVIQYEKAWKITPYKAWLLLTEKTDLKILCVNTLRIKVEALIGG